MRIRVAYIMLFSWMKYDLFRVYDHGKYHQFFMFLYSEVASGFRNYFLKIWTNNRARYSKLIIISYSETKKNKRAQKKCYLQVYNYMAVFQVWYMRIGAVIIGEKSRRLYVQGNAKVLQSYKITSKRTSTQMAYQKSCNLAKYWTKNFRINSENPAIVQNVTQNILR